MKWLFGLAGLGLWLAAPLSAIAADDGKGAAQESVVKIFATMRNPDPTRPWLKQSPRDATGSGMVIEGKRILTNAHVVLYSTQVFVQPNGSSEKLAATVESIGPGIDLAVLKLDDESFFDSRPPLPRAAELPEVKEAVMVYGYPQGGSSLAITKGIVSRIEFSGYNYHTSGVSVQIDAPINPGNSGGPALVGDKVVGLIYSHLQGADNIGYLIPTEEIELYLKDVADGKYDGKPAMHDQLQTLENDALRSKLKLDKKFSGMVVTAPDSADDSYPLKTWDVITKIGDHDIDNVGLVKIRPNLRLRFQYLIQKEAKDGKVRMSIVREGKETTVELPVKTKRELLIDDLKGDYPSYFVYGPLVFSPVTTEFLSGFDRMGDRFYSLLSLLRSPLVTRRGDKPKFEGEELVVVSSSMFPHKIGKGYSSPFSKVVKEVNGIPIKNLRHMVEVLRDATDKYTVFVFDDRGSEHIVFDRAEVMKATDDILTDNGVRRQASDDLTAIWEKKK